MSSTINFNVKFNVADGKIQATINDINGGFVKVDKSIKVVQDSIGRASESLKKGFSPLNFNSTLTAIENVSSGLSSLSNSGLDYSTQLADLSAITGVTGKDLDDLGAKARKSAKEFGGNAAESLNSYKTILSRLGPDIAKTPTALAEMERNVRVLSKTMGGDVKGATDALTTSMLQFGVDLSNPTQASLEMSKMMNIMAAGAKEGASEVPMVTNAINVAGVAMKQAKVSFAEGNAAIQALAQGGKEGAEAGTGLRNILSKIAGEDIIPKDAREKLRALGVNMDVVSNTSLPLTDRLRELKKAQADATVIAQVFGVENAATANILLDSIKYQDELKTKIEGTNTAYEQAAIAMDTPEEKTKRMQAAIDDLKITLFEASGGILSYAGVIGNLMHDLTALKPIYDGLSLAVSFLTSKQKLQEFWLNVLIAKEQILKYSKIGLTAVTTFFTTSLTTQNIAQKASALWTGILAAKTWLWTTAQWAINAALTMNPIGIIIVAIGALIALIVACIAKYNEWGAAILLITGPIGLVINAIMALKRNWQSVKDAFSTGGILAGLKRIGIVLLDTILYPVQQLLELLSKIPGMANLAANGAEKIANLRKKLNLVDPESKKADSKKSTTASINTEAGIQKEIEKLMAKRAKLDISSDAFKKITEKINQLQAKLSKATGGNEIASSFVPTTTGTGKGSKSGIGSKTNEAIATGGVKPTVIQLHIKNMVETFKVEANGITETAEQVSDNMLDALNRALGIALTTAQ